MNVSTHAIAASFALAAALAVACPALASDTTIPCNSPPTAGANVAVHSGTQVATTKDKANGTCTFSINGAVATSPPAGQVMEALSQFHNAGRTSFFRESKTMASAVAALLAAAAPVNEVPSDLVNLLMKGEKGLTRCLSDFFEKKSLPSLDSKDFGFGCKSFEPYRNGDEKTKLIRAGEPAVDVPTLVITVEWQQRRFVSVLYLPLSLVR